MGATGIKAQTFVIYHVCAVVLQTLRPFIPFSSLFLRAMASYLQAIASNVHVCFFWGVDVWTTNMQ